MVILIGVLYFFGVSSDEIKNDLIFITKTNPIYLEESTEEDISSFTLKQTSEIKLAFTGLIRLYQLYVSPQGPPVCNFTISCSRFLTEAVRKHGVVHGLLMGSDRLLRCVRGSRRHYLIDTKTGKAIDYPVEVYSLGNPKTNIRYIDSHEKH